MRLEECDCSHNQLAIIPNEVGRITCLRRLNVSNNRLVEMSAEVGRLKRLERVCGKRKVHSRA